MTKSTLIHLRFPFSFFLMPVFLFASAISQTGVSFSFVIVLGLLHFLLYPASNGYNSYFDKDEGSIGGVKNPPKVQKQLYMVSLIMDGLALIIALIISWQFSLMLLIYGLVSKAYSHPMIRLKSKPILGWLAVGIFQGYWTFLMTVMGLLDLSFEHLIAFKYQFPALLSSALLLGSYPMTQIYQHEEDFKRGDRTISIILGLNGTFLFTALFFTLSTGAYMVYFYYLSGMQLSLMFQVFLLPVLVFFVWWFLKSLKNKSLVNYENTMRLNLISAAMLNAFFVYLMFVL